MNFLRDLEKEVRSGIDEILTHSYIQRLGRGELSKKDLLSFSKEYGVYCMHFPRFLAAIAANIDNDQERMSLVENLWEEHGEGDIKLTHRALYFKFAESLGYKKNQFKISDSLVSTSICVENLMYICKNAHYVESMGAIGLGTEYFTSEEYQIIFDGLKQYDFFKKGDLDFWSAHIGLDDEHYHEMMDNIMPYLDKARFRNMLKRGAIRAIELEIMFWDGLEEQYLEKK